MRTTNASRPEQIDDRLRKVAHPLVLRRPDVSTTGNSIGIARCHLSQHPRPIALSVPGSPLFTIGWNFQ